jgi:hypothetical protein
VHTLHFSGYVGPATDPFALDVTYDITVTGP